MTCKDYNNWKVRVLATVAVCVSLSGCTRWLSESTPSSDYVYMPMQMSVLENATVDPSLVRFAPAIVVEDDWASWNRPGTAIIARDHNGVDRSRIDPTRASVYTESRHFETASGRTLTNYIYRLHFDRVPVRYAPFHITAGPNGGIMVVVTTNEQDTALLYTLVHSCGCYIAFIPTTALASDARPVNWPSEGQTVFKVPLPAELEASDARVQIRVAAGEHRMIGIEPVDSDSDLMPESLIMRPMSALDRLVDADGETQSFFISKGRGKGWVRDTRKPFEMALMSWWALDPRVGVDKRYGQPGDDAPAFYTSLKPWQRSASDMRDFAQFLAYWGWRL